MSFLSSFEKLIVVRVSMLRDGAGIKGEDHDPSHARHPERCRLGPRIACLRTLTIAMIPSSFEFRAGGRLVRARNPLWRNRVGVKRDERFDPANFSYKD